VQGGEKSAGEVKSHRHLNTERDGECHWS